MGKVRVAPGVRLNDCIKKAGHSNFSAVVHLETHAGKGCDRETYDASGMYAICGAGNFVDLLPKPGVGQEWTKDLKKEVGSKGTEQFHVVTFSAAFDCHTSTCSLQTMIKDKLLPSLSITEGCITVWRT